MFARPISATLLLLTVTFVAWSIVNRRLVKKSLMEAATDV